MYEKDKGLKLKKYTLIFWRGDTGSEGCFHIMEFVE
jgi:hypothetical protein